VLRSVPRRRANAATGYAALRGGRRAGVGDDASDGFRERFRILSGYQKSTAAGQHFDSVRKCRGDDRYTGADRLGEQAGEACEGHTAAVPL
jgi:hypothetical protein